MKALLRERDASGRRCGVPGRGPTARNHATPATTRRQQPRDARNHATPATTRDVRNHATPATTRDATGRTRRQ